MFRQPLPEPDGDAFRGRVVEAFDLVENVMIETGDERVDDSLQIGEVHDPPAGLADRAADGHFSTERMAVHPAAFVPFCYIRQEVSGFKAEILHEFDWVTHGALDSSPLVELLL